MLLSESSCKARAHSAMELSAVFALEQRFRGCSGARKLRLLLRESSWLLRGTS